MNFFLNRTFKVALSGFWIIIIFIILFLILHLAEPKTTCLCLKPKIDPPYCTVYTNDYFFVYR